jgi:hypothetical protein
LAAKAGLKHKSTGKGENRFLTVSKLERGPVSEDEIASPRLHLRGYISPFLTRVRSARPILQSTTTNCRAWGMRGDMHFWRLRAERALAARRLNRRFIRIFISAGTRSMLTRAVGEALA